MSPDEVILVAFASEKQGKVVFTNESLLVVRNGFDVSKPVERFDYRSTSLSLLQFRVSSHRSRRKNGADARVQGPALRDDSSRDRIK